jgi:hypothetical protein
MCGLRSPGLEGQLPIPSDWCLEGPPLPGPDLIAAPSDPIFPLLMLTDFRCTASAHRHHHHHHHSPHAPSPVTCVGPPPAWCTW